MVLDSLGNTSDWKARTDAIEKLERGLPGFLDNRAMNERHICGVVTLVAKLVDDTNFKISLTAIRILTTVTNHHNTYLTEDCLRVMVPTLVNRLSDNKIVIRHALLKTFHSLAYVSVFV